MEIFEPHQLNLLNVLTLWCIVQNNTHRELTRSYNYYQIPDVFLFPILFGSEPNVQMGKGDILYSVKFMKESWEFTEWAPSSFQNSPDATSLICLLVGSLASLALTMSDTMPSDHSDLDSREVHADPFYLENQASSINENSTLLYAYLAKFAFYRSTIPLSN